MFKDIGQYLLFEKKLYKVFVFLARFGIILAVALVFYLPYQSQSNDIEENALNPELLSQSMSNEMSEKTEKYLIELQNATNIQDYVINMMQLRGLEATKQDFTYKHENGTNIEGSNLIARLHTKRSHGYECNLFTYEYSKVSSKNKLRNVALILSFIRILQNQEINYLSRDILFVGFETEFKEYGRGINKFLQEYFHPQGISKIPRCGVIREAINLNLDDDFNTIALKLIGLNGRVPDRDFFLNINHLLIKLDMPYYYQENGTNFIDIQNFMELKLRQFWSILQLDQFYVLPQAKIFRFNNFFGMLLEGLQGDLHEAHSYLFKYGIHAVTLRGYHTDKQDKQLSQSYVTMMISRVLEGANRAYMALDEHLHAASTMYIPTQKRTSITIQNYVWPCVIITSCVSILAQRQTLLDVQLVQDSPQKKHLSNQVAMVWLKHIIIQLSGFAALTSPYITEIITGEQFCSLRDNSQILDSMFSKYLLITFGIYLFTYLIFVRLTRKVLFGTTQLERSYVVGDTNHSVFAFTFVLGIIYTVILHLPTSIFVTLLFSLWIPFIQPIRPLFKTYNLKSIGSYTINLLFVAFYINLARQFLTTDFILSEWKSVLENYMCVGTHLQIFIHVIGLTNLVKVIDILVY